MKLNQKEAELYFRLMWALQFYVNSKLKINPDIKSIEKYMDADNEKTGKVREALFGNPGIIDSFTQENPQHFSKEDLEVVSKWKGFIGGSFFIERLLKKYAVFIQNDAIYGVLALSQSFEEVTWYRKLPLYVETYLLPFKGKIIYDGMLGMQNIVFGGGIKHNLKETYLRAKQDQRIICTLEKEPEKQLKKTRPKELKDWSSELDVLALKAKKLKGSVDHPATYSPAFSLIKASIEFAQFAASEPEDAEGVYIAMKKVRRAFKRLETVVNRGHIWI